MSTPSFTPQQLTDFAVLVAAAMSSAQATRPKPPAMKDLGIAKPTSFTGGSKDYPRFHQECLAYISTNEAGELFTNDKKKIAFVLSYMKEGTASTWAQNYYNGITNDQGVIKIIDTFKKFLEQLDLSFKDPGEHECTYKYWSIMTQENLDASVFLSQFKIVMSEAGISVNDVHVVLLQLKMVLHQEVKEGLICLQTKPKMYNEMKVYTIEIDANEKEICQLQHQNAPPPLHRQPFQSAPQRPALFDPSRGDKQDATGVTFGGQGKPMQVALQHLRREGKCFECGKAGHYARQCPKKKTAQTACAIVAELSDELKELLCPSV